MADSEISRFAEVLAAIENDLPPGAQDIPAVGAAIVRFRERMHAVDNLGRTGDERDLYVLLEELTAAVKAAYPGSLCQAGCSGCCESEIAVFHASPAEWALIEDHLDGAMPEADKQALAARFDREHRQRLWPYRLLGMIRYFEPVADRYFEKAPYRCPFLVGGRCSIYPVRPLACRMYGYFAIRSRWYSKPGIYACNKQVGYYHGLRAHQELRLPSVNMVTGRFRRLLKGRDRLLPIWLARYFKARL